MAIIFNSKECGITEEQMKILYRNNLIKCDDFTFTVATIPDWAIEEAQNLVKKEFNGTVLNESFVSENKNVIKLMNRSSYPRLYKETMKIGEEQETSL